MTEDQYAVPSTSDPHRFYSVVVDIDHGLARCLCDCASAIHRPELPVACRHGAAVLSDLVERGELRRIGGLAYRIPSRTPALVR